MQIQLSHHFSYAKLLRFTLPSIIMMVFTSIYGVVDGFFVSNYVGKTPFAAVNIIYPFIMVLGAVGFMLGTGGSALVSKTLGEGDREKARSLFSLFTYTSFIAGVVIAVLGIVFTRPIAVLLGAEDELLEYCVIYGRIILAALPFFMLQNQFQSFFVTDEKPQLGLAVTVIAGVANMFLDWLFMAVFNWGLAGAAIATAASQVLGGVIPLVYFYLAKKDVLHLGKTRIDGRALLKACTNGSSELMSNVSMSLVSMIYNAQLLKYAGEDGVAAYGVIMYVNMIFLAVFIGYSIGTAPVIGYHFGAENRNELKSILKKSLVIISIFAVIMFAASEILARPLSLIFVSYDEYLLDMTMHAFSIYSFAFLLAGFAIFGSSFFTSLSDGLTSALISFLRTLVFQIAAVIILPLIWGLDGIWYSCVVAEVMAVVTTAVFFVLKRKKYGYF